MSLNFLTCSQLLQRTDSYEELLVEKTFKNICKEAERSWSSKDSSSSTSKGEQPKGGGMPKIKANEQPKGGAVPKIKANEQPKGAVAKIKANHRRNYSAGDVPYSPGSGPKLVRSSGMRRNWSLKDLTEKKEIEM